MTVGPEHLSLEGKVAVVTGAAQGIGAAVAASFAALGADVAMCDRTDANRTAEAVVGAGRQVHTAVLDVRDEHAVEGFFTSVRERFGHLDVLVNNAGGGFAAPFLEVTPKGRDALVRENFTSVAACIAAAVPLVPARGGSVINITSIEAHRAAPGYAIYAAMKAAVENLTRSLALELGARMIRVNAIAPDVIPTPGIGDPPVRTPLPVAGHVDDVAGAAAYLASDLARFVTGTTLHVDGGNLAASGWRRRSDGDFEP